MTNAFKLTVEPNNIARLIFDLPNEKVNKLTAEVLDELNQITDELRKRQDIKILLLMSAKEDIFIAGADLKEFEVKNTIKTPKQRQNFLVFVFIISWFLV